MAKNNFVICNINDTIIHIFLDLMKKYSLGYKPFIGDMLIAASAIHYNIELFTLNIKDFDFIPELHIYKAISH